MRLKAWMGAVSIGAVCCITGCAGFFPANSTSTSTTSSGDYLYVANYSTDTLSEYVVGSGALTAVSGSPIALPTGLAPTAVTVSRANTFVYVGGTGTIVVYSIGTGGALTQVSGGGISLTNTTFVSLATSPDGQWLLALDSTNNVIHVYGINASTGALTSNQSLGIGAVSGAGTMTPRIVTIAPSGALAAIALGTGGDVLFTFNTSTGVLAESSTGIYSSSNFSDNAVVFDATSSYLLVARSGTTTGTSVIATYTVTTAGVPSGLSSVATSDAPYGLLVDHTGAYIYCANRSAGKVTGYGIASGVLTALSNSPFSSGLNTTALAEDNTHSYVIAASSSGSPDLTLYSFDALTGGKLDAVEAVASGTDPAESLALATTY